MHQLSFVSRVEDFMTDEHRDIHEQTLCMLLSKLKAVTLLLNRLVKQPTSTPAGASQSPASDAGNVGFAAKTIKYAFKKESLSKAIDELETWQKTADQSWFLIMKIADPRIDEALHSNQTDVGDGAAADAAIPEAQAVRAAGYRKEFTGPLAGSGITIRAEELDRMTIWPLPFSVVSLAVRVLPQGTTATYVLSRIQCQPLAKYDMIKGDARNLARKLQHTDPHAFGLLSCKGLAVPSTIPEREQHGTEPLVHFTMILRVPPSSGNPQSLRDLLLNTPWPLSLSFRFSIAQELAKAVSYVHTFGFVHKTIRPESILTFEKTDSNDGCRSVFLVGFENFRKEHGWTQRLGDNTLDRNLYRHPSRQGLSPREDYVMQHDIYSLGVCLLEIGLWKSLVTYSFPDQNGNSVCLPTDLLLGAPPGTVNAREMSQFLMMQGKDRLLHLARMELPRVMGTKYAEIVQTCLLCLDPQNANFGDAHEFEDEDGVLVGLRYIEKVRQSESTLLVNG
jgi:hypothetical protein